MIDAEGTPGPDSIQAQREVVQPSPGKRESGPGRMKSCVWSYTCNGETKTFVDHEQMLARLLYYGVVFIAATDISGHSVDERRYQVGPTLHLSVNANDVFYWGCADAEDITIDEVPDLYALFRESREWGAIKWLSRKRKLRPQRPIVREMRAAGAWTEELEALPEPPQ